MEEKKQPRIKILVACHKADPNIRQDDIYMPIQVGKALHPELDLGFQCDNTGDNISEKNGSYCELTALYWAWKNLKDVDYIGLCHYRRYFDFSKIDDVREFIRKTKTIVPKPIILNRSIFTELAYLTSIEDTYILLDTILQIYPKYKKDVLSYYFYNNKFSPYNMFIFSAEQFSSYCSFLFNILEKFEDRIKLSPYTRQRRVVGYMGETLLGLWIECNKIKHKTLNVENVGTVDSSKIKDMLARIRNNAAFVFSRPITSYKSIDVMPSVAVGLASDSIHLSGIKEKNYD